MNANNYLNQKERGLKRKYEYIMSRGGKCECCGYDKNIAALELHHINPNEKEFQIDMRRFANSKLDDLKQELDKCQILCANCHREIHNPDLTMTQISETLSNSNKKSFMNEGGSICPVCGKRFPKKTGKIYCSKECRIAAKNYPTKDEVESQYLLLHSWQKVADYFGVTRRIISGIRKS